MFVGSVEHLLALLQPRFNPLWVPNAFLSDYTFNSCRAGFLVRDVLTVIRWRVQIVDLRPHKTITNPNRFAADFFRVRHLAHVSTYQLRIATFASCPKGIPWCASNHGFCRYPHRKVLSVEPIGELRTVPPDFELCSAYWPKLKTTPA